MAPKWFPKRIKNRSKNMMDFLIDFGAVLEPPSAGRPPARERAGAVEGVGGGINPSPERVKRRISGFDCWISSWSTRPEAKRLGGFQANQKDPKITTKTFLNHLKTNIFKGFGVQHVLQEHVCYGS